MSIVPSSRIEDGHSVPDQLRGRSREPLTPFEQHVVQCHIEDVLDGRQPVDTEIVALAGGFAKFEEQMDYVENVRMWQASRRGVSVWRGLLRNMIRRICPGHACSDGVCTDGFTPRQVDRQS